MERNKLINQYSDYINDFNMEDPIIALKYTHGLNVATFSYEIAKRLALTEKEEQFAYFIGLFHDLGSFEAWRKHKSFLDTSGSIKLLFEENYIKNFNLTPTQRTTFYNVLLLFEDKDQNLKKVQKYTSGLKDGNKKLQEILLFYNILKDADTLDFLGMIKRKTLPPILLPTGKKARISNEILLAFKNENKIEFDDAKTRLDEIILILSLFFDLQFDYSRQFALKIDFAQAVYDFFDHELTQEEKEKLKKLITKFKEKNE